MVMPCTWPKSWQCPELWFNLFRTLGDLSTLKTFNNSLSGLAGDRQMCWLCIHWKTFMMSASHLTKQEGACGQLVWRQVITLFYDQITTTECQTPVKAVQPLIAHCSLLIFKSCIAKHIFDRCASRFLKWDLFSKLEGSYNYVCINKLFKVVQIIQIVLFNHGFKPLPYLPLLF